MSSHFFCQDSTRNKFYISSGLSFNTFSYHNSFQIAKYSPISGYIEWGLVQKEFSNKLNWLSSINYQPYFLLNHYTEFYNFQRWTSAGITADYIFHKLNFNSSLLYQWNDKWSIGIGLGISYTFESIFNWKGFVCSYPYESPQYKNEEYYYKTAFYDNDKGVILNKIFTPFLSGIIWYKINEHWNIKLDTKYELNKVPNQHKEWYFFRMVPLSLGAVYCF